MAFSSAQASVTTSAAVVTSATDTGGSGDDWAAKHVLIRNITNTSTIWIGGSNVAANTGTALLTTDTGLAFDLEPGESVYAVSPAGTQTISVLTSGR